MSEAKTSHKSVMGIVLAPDLLLNGKVPQLEFAIRATGGEESLSSIHKVLVRPAEAHHRVSVAIQSRHKGLREYAF